MKENQALSTEEIKMKLYKTLSLVAREIIASDWYEQPNDPQREEFLKNPDNYLQHESDWHQWGIITHTVMTGRYIKKVPMMLEMWFGRMQAKTIFGLTEEYIDDKNKWELLIISLPLHDYGKFAVRHYRGLKSDGKRPDFDFHGHETKSGMVIRAWHDRFRANGLTKNQIEYIASCAELHYELGKIRKLAKESKIEYTLSFTHSNDLQRTITAIIAKQSKFSREIGIMFIADSLGKTDFHQAVFATTDSEILARRLELEAIIKKRFPQRPELIDIALQLPVNVAVGYQCLKQIVT